MKGGVDYPTLQARFYRDYGGFPDGSVVKNLPATVGDIRDSGSISGSGRSPGGGPGSPLQYSCLENMLHSMGCKESDTTERLNNKGRNF